MSDIYKISKDDEKLNDGVNALLHNFPPIFFSLFSPMGLNKIDGLVVQGTKIQ